VVHGSKGKVERFKARLITKGFTRGQGVDSHVSNKISFRTNKSKTFHFFLKLHQMNVEIVFLNRLTWNCFLGTTKGFCYGRQEIRCGI